MSKRPSSVCHWTAAFLAAVGLLMLLSEKVLALDLSYGGRLSSPSGEPVAGPVDITFHFYREASGGSVLVSVPMANMPLVDGIFQTSIPLSAVEAERLFEDGDQTVYVEVESQGRIYPRQKFSYVPLALRVPVDGSKIVYDAEGRLTFGPGASPGTGNLNGISGIGGVERLVNGSYATFGLSSSGKSLLGAADSSAQRSLLGLGSMATRNSVALSDLPSCADGSVLRYSGSSWSCAVLGPSIFDAAVDAAEFAALNGVTSSIQTQLNSKLSASGGAVTGSLTLSQGSELRLATSNAGVSAGFKAPSNMATSTIYTLPSGFATAGQVLTSSSTGVLSWMNIPVTAVNGQTGNVLIDADNINETASRKYYSHSLARQALSSTGLLSYNSTTGVLSLSDTLLTKSGGTMTGGLDFGGTQKITNLADPTSPGDAAKKSYVDAQLGGQPLEVGTPSPGQVVKWDGVKFTLATDALGEPGGGIASLNTLTTDSQSLAVEVPGVTSGTRPSWTAVSATSTHRLTIPMASQAGVTAGLIAKTDYDTFSAKQEAITVSSSINAGMLATNQQNALEIKPYGTESNNTGELRFRELVANGTNYVSLKAPDALASNLVWTLPFNDGPDGFVLSTNGSGMLSWISPSTGSVTNITTGTGLTGGSIASVGTIALANVGTAGTYTKVTTNAQGQVVSGAILSDTDIPSLSAAKITSGTVSVALGGTGATSFANNGVLVGSGSSPLSATVAGTQYQVLRAGAGGAPAFGSVNLDQSSAVTGILPVSNGGTGAAAAAAARTNLGAAASGANGDITSLTGLTTALSVAQGGTGATTAASARTNLGAAASGANSDITSLSGLTSLMITGNVGIGTISPGAMLDVFGGGRFKNQNALEVLPYSSLAGNTGELRFDELAANGTNYIGLKSPDNLSSDVVWTLPSSDGTGGHVLSTNGSGILSWVSPSLGSVTNIATGTGLTGGPITSTGTISLANVGTAGTYTKVSTNAQGQVTTGTSLLASDIPALDASKITTGTLAVALGGTGATSFTNNGVLVGSGASNLSATFAGTQYQVLRAGASGVPAFGAINLDQTAAVTGALGLANGGTGAVTAAAARTNLELGTAATLNVGTAGFNVVQLDASSRLPTVNGTLLTGVVKSAGDTMTGTLNLPSNGLAVGTNQLVVIGGNVGIGTTSPAVSLDMGNRTDALALPSGTTAQQPTPPATGWIRYNSTNTAPEYYNGTSWIPMGSAVSPAGMVASFSMATCPTGWLAANGAAVSRTTYAALFSAIGSMYGDGNGTTTFNLPDYRGYFLRGWNNSVGIDPDAASRTNRGDGTTGDAVGTKQADQYSNHRHSISYSSEVTNGSPPWSYTYSNIMTKNTGAGISGTRTDQSDFTGGNETRPKNINVIYCVSTAINPTVTTSQTGSGTTNYVPAWTSGTALGNSPMFVNGANVGIGTTVPNSSLEIAGDITLSDKFIHAGDVDTAIRFPAVDTVSVETTGSERLRITSAGNVGIGTTAPADTLQVAGGITAKGIKQVNNGAQTQYDISFRKYHVEATKAFERATVDLDMSLVNSLCKDDDGCSVTLSMKNWDAAQPGNVASRGPYQFWMSQTSNWWRVNTDTLGSDGNSTVEHILTAWACYFTDGAYVAGSGTDTSVGFGLMNWTGYDTNMVCMIDITD